MLSFIFKTTFASPVTPIVPVLETSKDTSLPLVSYLLLKFTSLKRSKLNAGYDVALMVYDKDESLKSKVTFESLKNISGGFIGDIVPDPVDVIPTKFGKSRFIS